MFRGETGFEPFENAGDRQWIYYAPVGSSGWMMVVVFPEAELLANIRQLSRNMTVIALVGILLIVGAVSFLTRKLVLQQR